MNFTMTTPCENCPFRTDVKPFIRAGRAREIADGLMRRDQTFQCHKTIDYAAADESDEDGEPREPNTLTANAQHCAGALIMLEHEDRPNQMMRIGERVGFYDRRKLKMEAPVYRSARAFVAAHVTREKDKPNGLHTSNRKESRSRDRGADRPARKGTRRQR